MERIEAEDSMEDYSDQKDTTKLTSGPKGGLLTMPFIIANEAFEKVASYGLLPNMIFYLAEGYRMSLADGTSVLHLWSAMTNFTPLLGAFLSDSYFGRFQVIVMGSISSLLGVILLWLTAMIPAAKPPRGESPDSGQLGLLFGAFALISLGAGGIRPCSIAFGADQLTSNKNNPKNERILHSYFNFYYATIGLSSVTALTVIVYIQDHFGWRLGFGIPAILMVLSVLTFILGYPLYIKAKADKSLFTGLAQVIVVTFKNRSLAYPVDGKYHTSKDSKFVAPSKHMRYNACLFLFSVVLN
ncbi:NRT1/ PTR FAMILY 1.2 [Thalictrum thalictroides]|uniref:NRT1/ PTR FAMILY 1.2 n=1 Tax=Thalictrum thalictroides TaxID=46969 RepID=A0A7J6W9S9_THATH|nr:NRT1/ PTR FAMILY 1.2 [Thalictrum thalictroides]